MADIKADKFREIAKEFTNRIGLPLTVGEDGTFVQGESLTLGEVEIYCNQAMLKLYEEVFTQSDGQPDNVLKIFPELRSSFKVFVPSIAKKFDFHSCLDEDGETSIQNKNAHILLSGYLERDGVKSIVRVLPEKMLPMIISGSNNNYTYDLTEPIVIQKGHFFYLFPYNYGTLLPTKLYLDFLIMPIPPDGTYYGVNAIMEDIPFLSLWKNRIVDIAVDLYNKQVKNYQ